MSMKADFIYICLILHLNRSLTGGIPENTSENRFLQNKRVTLQWSFYCQVVFKINNDNKCFIGLLTINKYVIV